MSSGQFSPAPVNGQDLKLRCCACLHSKFARATAACSNSFAVDGKKLPLFAAVSRIRRDGDADVEGYQRPEVLSHIASIRRYLESGSPMIPNALCNRFRQASPVRAVGGSSFYRLRTAGDAADTGQ